MEDGKRSWSWNLIQSLKKKKKTPTHPHRSTNPVSVTQKSTTLPTMFNYTKISTINSWVKRPVSWSVMEISQLALQYHAVISRWLIWRQLSASQNLATTRSVVRKSARENRPHLASFGCNEPITGEVLLFTMDLVLLSRVWNNFNIFMWQTWVLNSLDWKCVPWYVCPLDTTQYFTVFSPYWRRKGTAPHLHIITEDNNTHTLYAKLS